MIRRLAFLPIIRRLAFFILEVPLLCARAISHELNAIRVINGPT